MQNQIIHKESQRFSGAFTYLFLSFSLIFLLLYLLGFSGFDGMDFLKTPELLWAFIFTICLWFLFRMVYLETLLFNNRIEIKFFPFHAKNRVFYFEDISAIEVRKYNPLIEFGGWGIRYRSLKNMAYNISGSQGIQLIFKSGKRVLIGTQEAEIWKRFLKNDA